MKKLIDIRRRKKVIKVVHGELWNTKNLMTVSKIAIRIFIGSVTDLNVFDMRINVVYRELWFFHCWSFRLKS